MEKRKHEAVTLMESVFRHCTDGYIYTVLLPKNCKANVIKKIRYFELSKITLIPNYISILINNFDCYFSPTVCNKDFGCHGRSKDDIKQWPTLWCDIDIYKFNENKQREIWKLINDFPLPPSFIIKSGKGIHVYWILKEPSRNRDLIKNYLGRLAIYFSGDPGSAEVAHLLRIPQTKNHKYNSPENEVSITGSRPEKEYSLDDFEILLNAEEISKGEERPYSQEANERLNQIMECEFLKHCVKDRVDLPEPQWYAMISILERQTGGISLIHSLSQGYPRYNSKETNAKIRHANEAGPATCERIKTLWDCKKDCGVRSPAVLALRANQDESTSHADSLPSQKQPSWPSPLAKEGFYGLAGEFVSLIEPHTEADPAALLAQILAAIGNVIGATAFFQVEADKHYLKIFPVLVGETAKGRKGTSWGYVKDILKRIDPNCRVTSGLSSGEGLIWQVRDKIIKQGVVVDPGIEDKRLFIIEQEFASTLRIIGRDGNVLSPIVRQAWDDGNLEQLAKNSPAKATGAHISIIGHITRDELRRYLDRTEIGNGFANRFIWFCIRRSKTLPDGGQFYKQNLESILERLKKAVEFGGTVGEMEKDSGAKKIWNEVYPTLSEGKLGLFGAVTSRGEAQVMRIACIYAVLDKSKTIRTEHLLAALAIWDYSESSARYIFGDATGDLVADRILESLKCTRPNGLTRTEISNLFSRNRDRDKIDFALALLQRHRLVSMVKESSGGRPVEKWVAI